MGKSIIVTVGEDGKIEIAAVGFTGNACEKATKAIEQALGKPGKSTKKPEFFQNNTQQQKAGL